jgi:hypothetical protein
MNFSLSKLQVLVTVTLVVVCVLSAQRVEADQCKVQCGLDCGSLTECEVTAFRCECKPNGGAIAGVVIAVIVVISCCCYCCCRHKTVIMQQAGIQQNQSTNVTVSTAAASSSASASGVPAVPLLAPAASSAPVNQPVDQWEIISIDGTHYKLNKRTGETVALNQAAPAPVKKSSSMNEGTHFAAV